MSAAPKQKRTESQPSPQSNEAADPVAGVAADSTAGVRTIKKYPNRRLYDTQTSSYITLSDVKEMVMGCEQFVIVDAKSGEDLTRSILLQIILEEESAGMPMFSTQALAQIIRLYGNTMQGLMGNYLEKNIQSFIDLQSRLTENSVKSLQNPLMQTFMGGYIEQSRQMFAQMQEQMGKQAESLIGNLGAGLTPKK
ncbi:MAG: polyhydroxyalkanoate synthesis repressor PhaR [Aquabacterium sp.]|jgi:polyhydroxyalkanoate synthesis repressor PhaR|uniref:polyhydroxyalkanoate synthesis repressor PhaR n=1 Tax=Aquabacterium sp. TaxID=1872578 RepID=UPI002A370088|nr:polyhydroxyalkanoate synthesis repressor PhaR [Aquabacterium sp.]MDX9842247.1 polyhydroxyalkanoate synthesis repressor PhaR [Aquabacterium sp.]